MVTVNKVNQLSPTRVSLSVSVSSQLLVEERKKVVRKYISTAKMPGFRPGKAPQALVEQKYAEKIQSDVMDRVLNTGISESLKKSEKMPIDQPQVVLKTADDLTKDIDFDIEFDVRPELTLKDYKGIEINKEDITVSDEEIDKHIEHSRESHATFEASEETIPSKGLIAVCDVKSHSVEALTEPQEARFEIGKVDMPELEDKLVTMTIGDIEDVEIGLKDKDDEEKQTFSVTLKKIEKKILPELNEEFFNKACGKPTLDEFKELIKNYHLETRAQQQHERNRDEIMTSLLETNSETPVPNSMKDSRLESMKQGYAQRMAQQKGVDVSQVELSEQEVKNLEETAIKQAQASLILSEIAMKEDIKLDEELMKSRVEGIGAQYGLGYHEILKLLQDKHQIQRLRDETLTDQVFDFLIKNANLNQVPKK